MLRAILASAAGNTWLRERVPRYRFARRAVRRFVPGEDLDAALVATRGLFGHNIRAILTQLGESVTDRQAADAVAEHYHEMIRRVRSASLDAQPSVKPTQLGLDLESGSERYYDNLKGIVIRAAELNNFIWIDMEASRYVDATLQVFERLRREHANVGICLQACLFRTSDDLARVMRLGAGVRIVKGAYKEPSSIAFPRKRDVDRNFLALSERLLSAEARQDGSWAAFGTHDKRLISEINAMATRLGVDKSAYEFQMLYGIQREEQERLARAGYRVRVMINYGTHWFPWYMRRLAERPANLLFVMKNLWTR